MKKVLPTIYVKLMAHAAERSVKIPTLKTAYQPSMPPALKAKKNSRYPIGNNVSDRLNRPGSFNGRGLLSAAAQESLARMCILSAVGIIPSGCLSLMPRI